MGRRVDRAAGALHRINGALVLRPRSMKPAATGRLFIERALENAGIPVLADRSRCRRCARMGSKGGARESVRSFLEKRVIA